MKIYANSIGNKGVISTGNDGLYHNIVTTSPHEKKVIESIY